MMMMMNVCFQVSEGAIAGSKEAHGGPGSNVNDGRSQQGVGCFRDRCRG